MPLEERKNKDVGLVNDSGTLNDCTNKYTVFESI